MNAPQTAQGPGFLAALAAIARHDDFNVKVAARKGAHGHLSVTIEADGHPPLKAAGWPNALDAQLPEAIAKYAAWIERQAAKDEADQEALIEFPRGLDTEAPRPAKRVRAAPARRKAVARRKPSAKAKPPATKRAAPRRAPPARRAVRSPLAGKPGKAECIADYKALRAKYGDELTRRGFIKQATTGRRYEKLWKNWEEFTAEAGGGKPPAATPAHAAKPARTNKAAPAKKAAAAPKAKTTDTKDAPQAKGPWAVKAGGKKIGATIFNKKPGDTVLMGGSTYTVQSVDENKRVLHVEPAGAKPGELKSWGDIFPSKAPTEKPAATEKPKPPYAIRTADDKRLGASMEELKIGAPWGLGDKWEVVAVDHNKREYTVRSRDEAAAADLLSQAQATAQEETAK